MKFKLIVFLTLFPFLLISQENIIPEEKWKLQLNTTDDFSKKDWVVFMENNKVYARQGRITDEALPFKIKPEEEYGIGHRSVAKVKDGYLVGYYAGEWGGILYWFSPDGKKKYTISTIPTLDFIIRDNKLYALQGLHSGTIAEIIYENGIWKSKNYLFIDSPPFCIAKDANNNFW